MCIWTQLWIDYFRERDTTNFTFFIAPSSCGLITLGNEIQLYGTEEALSISCGLITLGNEIQLYLA